VKHLNVDEIIKLITKSNAQKQIIRCSFGRKFHDLEYFELDFFMFLEINLQLRSISNNILGNHDINVILSVLSYFFDNYLFNMTACTPTRTNWNRGRVVILKSHIKFIKSIRSREFEKLLTIEALSNDVDFVEKVN
jgi:hypothetical protein